MEPKFSIIIPVYNVRDYIGECLNSVVNQTLRDIEIICVNDGTKDDSMTVVDLFAAKDDRIKIVNKANGGLASARNAGLKIATGRYVCFVDSDDYIVPTFCERIYHEILEHSPDVVGFGAEVFPLSKNTARWVVDFLSPYTDILKDVEDVASTLVFGSNRIYPFVWRNCFRREFLEENKISFDEHVKFGEDTVFQTTAFMFVKCAVIISDKLYCYRYDRKNSLMNRTYKDMYALMKEHITIVDCIGYEWESVGLLPKYSSEYAELAMDFVGYQLVKKENRNMSEMIPELMEVIKNHGAPVNADKIKVRYRGIYKKYLKTLTEQHELN